jgi:serine/threonine-protein kinase RsbT
MNQSFSIPAGDFSHAGQAASEIKRLLKQLNIPPKVIKRVVVALYEAEVNVVAHSFGGSISCTITPEHIDIVVSDSGPGISDIELAMSEGYSTASSEVREMGFGAGMGLPNIKNNSDSLDISSSEQGTSIHMRVNFKEHTP